MNPEPDTRAATLGRLGLVSLRAPRYWRVSCSGLVPTPSPGARCTRAPLTGGASRSRVQDPVGETRSPQPPTVRTDRARLTPLGGGEPGPKHPRREAGGLGARRGEQVCGSRVGRRQNGELALAPQSDRSLQPGLCGWADPLPEALSSVFGGRADRHRRREAGVQEARLPGFWKALLGNPREAAPCPALRERPQRASDMLRTAALP